MSNVVNPPTDERENPFWTPKISGMLKGETGYTVPWAYSFKTLELNTDFSIGEKGGTSCMRVECVGNDKYRIKFEGPRWRRINA